MNTSTQQAWYKDAIIYELHIKAFKDSNADGIGDFGGLIEQMDYLQDLGVTAIWLLPFYPSPQRDGGYDIADYTSINPDYGTLDEFKEVLHLAHERNMKVITELVINHTSDEHPWFQRARKAPKDSPERNFYVWSDSPDKYKDVRIIFQDFERSNWTWDPVAEEYFWHRFYSHQPDLNFDNPTVQEEIFKIIDYWVDMGVDGFRLDAIPYLFERENTNCENLPETHVFLKKLRAHVEQKRPDVLLLAEANMWPEDSASYFGDGDECHMNYHFPIMPRMFMSLKMEDRYPIIDIIDQTPEIPNNCQWGIFLRNHDELTLEMVTDEERDYMYRAYNKDDKSRINLGIRHRLAPLLDNNRQKIELMNILLFSLPGTPILYYGDEIGMGDNVHLGDRDGVRTPMQWNLDRNAGFSAAHPHSLYLPLINDPEYHHAAVNVEVQQKNASSLLWWMKRIISIRKRYQAFGRGNIQFLSPENAKVLAFTRSHQSEHLLVITNLSRHPQVVDLQLPGFEGYTPREVFGKTHFPPLERGNNRFTLGPYGYYWFELEPAEQAHLDWRPPMRISWEPEKWPQLARTLSARPKLEAAIQQYLEKGTRYVPNTKVIESVQVERHKTLTVKQQTVLWLVVHVTFTEGFPERYSIPVTCMDVPLDQRQTSITNPYSIAVLEGGASSSNLIDATGLPQFQAFLLETLLSEEPVLPSGISVSHLKPERIEHLPLYKIRTLKNEGNNFTLAFGEQYFLKIYSRLDDHINPDLEINQLAINKNLPVPGYLGQLDLATTSKKRPYTLALLQPYHKHNGTAYQYFWEACCRYLEEISTLQKSETNPEVAPPVMAVERAQLLGATTAQLHSGLIDKSVEAFAPESFSLHYQRSLYAGLQSQLRQTFQALSKKRNEFSQASALLDARSQLNSRLKEIYHHPIEALKIRIHGDLHLDNVLFDGKDFLLYDFEGERVRQYSELRLKKSPVRDVASLATSFFYVAISALKQTDTETRWKESDLLPVALLWYDHVVQALLSAYTENMQKNVIPENATDRSILFDTFLIDRLLYELQFELTTQRKLESVPLYALNRMIKKASFGFNL